MHDSDEDLAAAAGLGGGSAAAAAAGGGFDFVARNSLANAAGGAQWKLNLQF